MVRAAVMQPWCPRIVAPALAGPDRSREPGYHNNRPYAGSRVITSSKGPTRYHLYP
jgi:hypothetical protein